MRKIMILRKLLLLTFAFSLIFSLSFETNAQRKKSRSKKSTAQKRVTLREKRGADIKKGAEDVSIQIKNVTKFIYVLGGIAKGIEDIDKDVKAGKASRELAEKNAEYKRNVIRSLRALRAGLVKLEISFRTNETLKKYLINIQGISEASGKAEDLAFAGQFSKSGRELLLVVETLSDTLVAMRSLG